MTKRDSKFWTAASTPIVAAEVALDALALSADIIIILSADDKITELVINPEHDQLGCRDHWKRRDLRDFLTEEAVPKFETHARALRSGDVDYVRAAELNHFDNANFEFPVSYRMVLGDEDGGIIMVGRDMRQIAEVQQDLVRAQQALERDYDAFRGFENRYRSVMEASEEALIFVEAETGRVNDCNGAAAALLGISRTDLMGAPFVREFADRRASEFLDQLNSSARAGAPAPISVTSVRERSALLLDARIFRASGQVLLLCRLTPITPIAERQSAFHAKLQGLFADGADGIVFTDARGLVEDANEAFLELVGAADADTIRGRDLTSYLQRGGVDFKVMTENASGARVMRAYATRLQTELGSEIAAEVSVTPTEDQEQGAAGFAFVFRASRTPEPIADARAHPVSPERVRNLTELVGSSPLKDIVAATTDVIEKICIETAVDLTNNNRVAAAEMLGLSRQSLYVKLRKYGLLKRNDAAPEDESD